MHYSGLIQNYHAGYLSDNGEVPDADYKPFYAIDYKNPEALIEHLSKVLNLLKKDAEGRTENQLINLSFYNGIHTLNNGQTNIRSEDQDKQPVTMENRFVMNHILELTLQKQARLLRGGHELNVRPWNNEYAEKLGARLGKKVIDSAAYVHDFTSLYSELLLEAFICGESYLFVEWDPTIGEADPLVARAQKLAEQKIMTSFKNEDGETINLEEIAQIGDHKFSRPMPFHVLHEPRFRWRDVNYIFKATLKHIDQVRAENAGTDLHITAENTGNTKTFESDWGEWVLEWEFYHKRHRFIPEGMYVRFFNDTILEAGPLPYDHGELPVARFTDYDDPMNAHGRSFYEDLKLPSVMINNMMKVAYRSFCIAAYPKLIMQRDSCNMYSMANGPFVVEVNQGAMKPEIVSFNAVNKDFFPLAQHVESFMEKNSGIFSMSRGGTIPNARATGILNFYAEQEEIRDSSQLAKYTALQEKVGRHVLANSAQHYRAEDGRTLKIVGKNNVYKLGKIQENIRISGSHAVEVSRTTALSESKQGRVDQIVQLSSLPISGQEGPGLFTREQLLQMIEVSDTSTFFEMATAAAERASSENEDLFEGLPVEPPKEWQAHIVDWNIHFQYMQSREFSDTKGLPEEVRNAFLQHLRTHEFFLYEMCKKNMALAQVLATNKYFPAVFKLGPQDLPLSQIIILLSQPPMMPMAPQAATPPSEEGGAPADEEGMATEDQSIPGEIPPDAPAPPPKSKKKKTTLTKPDGSQLTAVTEDIEE